MEYTVKSLEEMPQALSYLIEKVESLQNTVNTLRNKQQVGKSCHWMNIDELCAYLPTHPKKQTVYGWVSSKLIPVHKSTKELFFLQSEIDDWLMKDACKTNEDLMNEAKEFISTKRKSQQRFL